MRILIGQTQRERILKLITPGCRVLEWGSGGSTLWLADRLPLGANLTSIDHDATWHEKTKQRIGTRPNVELLLRPPSGILGRNATEEEEDPKHLSDYIHVVDGRTFDIILVDGVARVNCMQRARELLSEDGVVVLHDAHRPWYDAGKALFLEHGTIGSCQEYPGPLLWWGGLKPEKPRYSIGALPIVINYYTSGTPYENEVAGLRSSLEKLGMESEIVGIKTRGSWEQNCAFKAQFIQDAYHRHDRPVLWIDADAVVHDFPRLLAGAEADFAIGKSAGWELSSGTVYFNRTPLAERLLKRWVTLCQTSPRIWDQIHLDRAWEEVTATFPLYTQWLPQTYVKIFDMAWESRLLNSGDDVCHPVVEHFQASRHFKEQVRSKGGAVQRREPSNALINARRACRPRVNFYDERFVLKENPPSPDTWATSTKSRFSLFK